VKSLLSVAFVPVIDTNNRSRPNWERVAFVSVTCLAGFVETDDWTGLVVRFVVRMRTSRSVSAITDGTDTGSPSSMAAMVKHAAVVRRESLLRGRRRRHARSGRCYSNSEATTPIERLRDADLAGDVMQLHGDDEHGAGGNRFESDGTTVEATMPASNGTATSPAPSDR
jgi:hypothetical protein